MLADWREKGARWREAVLVYGLERVVTGTIYEAHKYLFIVV